ncbi:hypothetical protein SNEBB_002262 [Seison nebaliae]|nr:hypothetical protein SNEBB_002262 [Seison nebaliae]
MRPPNRNSYEFAANIIRESYSEMDWIGVRDKVQQGILRMLQDNQFDSPQEVIKQLVVPLICLYFNQGTRIAQVIHRCGRATRRLYDMAQEYFQLNNTETVDPIGITLPRLMVVCPLEAMIAQTKLFASQCGVLMYYRAPLVYACGKALRNGVLGEKICRLHLNSRQDMDELETDPDNQEYTIYSYYADLAIQSLTVRDKPVLLFLAIGYSIFCVARIFVDEKQETTIGTWTFRTSLGRGEYNVILTPSAVCAIDAMEDDEYEIGITADYPVMFRFFNDKILPNGFRRNVDNSKYMFSIYCVGEGNEFMTNLMYVSSMED